MNRTATILLILSILSVTSAHSQYFQSTNFKEGSGLPSSETYMVYQDRKGFVWIGTDNGVVKYDGREFVTYNTAHGLTDNTVFGFNEDHKGRLWFRTYNGAISYYENDTIKPYKFNEQLKAFKGTSIISTLEPDTLGGFRFGTLTPTRAGRIDSAGNVIPLYGDSKDHDDIQKTTDPDGTNWYFFGYVGDKLLIAPSKTPREIKSIRIDGKEYPVDIDDRSTQTSWLTLSVKWRGKYYFSFHKNLFTYDGETVKKVFTGPSSTIALSVDREDHLWVGFFAKGVKMFRDESMTDPFTPLPLSNVSVSGIMQDYEGGIWISTLDQGVFYYPNLTIVNFRPPNNVRISAVAYGGGQLFIGNYSGDVFSMSNTGDVRHLGSGVAPVSNLFVDSENKLWVSHGQGTDIYKSKGNVLKLYDPGLRSFKVLTQEEDVMIAGTSMGIFKMHLDGTPRDSLKLRRRPTSLAVAGNVIYLGELDGLEKYSTDLHSPAIKIYEGRISSLHDLDSRFLAIGAVSKGLSIYDSHHDKLFPIPVADVVSIYSIVSKWDERRMWIGTDKGVFQLDFAEDDDGIALRSFSKADGLTPNKITNICLIDNDIWATSDLGISLVPLTHFGARNFVPKFYINRIIFENSSIGGNVRAIKTEERDMVFEIRPITFKGHPTMFRYRLDDEPWKVVSNGNIFLAHLPSEKYRLEIQASSGGDDWTEGTTIDITVMAKWWDTWVFRFGAAAVIILLGFVGYQFRISAIRRHQRYLELINVHQQKLINAEIETQERERKRIATDLHDGVGASLSGIKMQLTGVIDDEGPDRLRREKEINDNLNDVIADIKRIVYDLHPPGLERYGLRAALKSLAERVDKNINVRVIFDYYGESEVPLRTTISVYRIIQELINNTLKHAQASEIRIHINEFQREMNIMYEDNGIGMVGSRFTGLGLHSVESRVRSLNGRMTWESNHKGTFYNFDIPF